MIDVFAEDDITLHMMAPATLDEAEARRLLAPLEVDFELAERDDFAVF